MAHARWPLSRRASPSCEQERCVNFCLVPLSPSSSKWSTSTASKEREREGQGGRGGRQGGSEPARGGSREVGGGGRPTPHTDSLCALGRGAYYCEGVCIWGTGGRTRVRAGV